MSTYDYYRIFYHVAQHHSFTKAAEVLHNNQPNITRCMNNLETELGCHLFVRSNRGVSLTPEGQKLFNHVAIAFEQLELGEAELKRDQSLTSGLISIGVSENALRIMLLSKLEAFHNHYPHVRLKISNHSTPQAIASLESGLVDFAIVTTPLSVQKQFQKISLGSFREILIAGPKYKEPASRIVSRCNILGQLGMRARRRTNRSLQSPSKDFPVILRLRLIRSVNPKHSPLIVMFLHYPLH